MQLYNDIYSHLYLPKSTFWTLSSNFFYGDLSQTQPQPVILKNVLPI